MIKCGRINLDSLASMENLITLCLHCHASFDDDPPNILIWPEDLEYFIDYEEKDFDERNKRWVNEGTRIKRRVPSVKEVGHQSLKHITFIIH